jgi:hypothetical protein
VIEPIKASRIHHLKRPNDHKQPTRLTAITERTAATVTDVCESWKGFQLSRCVRGSAKSGILPNVQPKETAMTKIIKSIRSSELSTADHVAEALKCKRAPRQTRFAQ